MIPESLIKSLAAKHGFELCGFADYQLLDTETDFLRNWLEKGYHAGMKYMERGIDKREDIRNILPGAGSVISLGMNYNTGHAHENGEHTGKISRYAWGKDYHLVIRQKLDEIISELNIADPGFRAIAYTDTGPVMDKVWAVKSGLGWMGKHTNIINRENGSWFFIANIITNRTFIPSGKAEELCGTCTACIDACPTGAITDEYMLDANRCISYLTIENKNGIDDAFKNLLDGWIFGCDVCQDVCPWNNKFTQLTDNPDFQPCGGETNLGISAVMKLDKPAFEKRFKDSPVLRAKLKGIQRNAEALAVSRGKD